ncbi:MAG: ankyrin repeat domain-containing protein, partial [Alphaproteobacteria bacterium]|nr:ankyrin repeat domain-containing protein [Alphaproteobacteria bacterium]
MIKGGFNINQCDNEGKTLVKVWEKWCYDNIGGVFSEDLERARFLYSVGAKDETEESNRIKFELKQKNAEMERRKYLSTLPPKGEILSIEDALKYEDIEALKSLLKKGHSINKCDEYGNTLLEQCLTKWLKLHSKQEFDDRYGYIYSSEYMHVDRVRDILEYFGAKRNTSESMQIREQRFKESIEKEKREKEARKKELNNSKLAKVRNKVARVADKIAEATGTEKVVQKFTDGKKIADVEISEKNKVLEKKISDKLFGKVNE